MCAVHNMLLLCHTFCASLTFVLITQIDIPVTWLSVLSDIKAPLVIIALQISAPWAAA